jgi:hypothetical protein
MRENVNPLVWWLIIGMFCYSALLNVSLFCSMMFGFGLTLIIILVGMLNDDEIIEDALKGGEITPDLYDKVNSIFLMAAALFIMITTIIYNLLIKFN